MPQPVDDATRRRMQRQRRADTKPEMRLRRLLHARGLRYLVDAPLPLPRSRRRADLLFRGAHVAVFVDGCYWHSCPEHRTQPRSNAEWWRGKLADNVRRDRDTDAALSVAGWRVVRIWEHELGRDAEATAALVERVVRGSRQASSPGSSDDSAGESAAPTSSAASFDTLVGTDPAGGRHVGSAEA